MSTEKPEATPEVPDTETKPSAETTTPVVEATAPTPAVDPIAVKLAEVGLTEESLVKKIKEQGVEKVEDLALFTESDLKDLGVPLIKAKKLVSALHMPVTSESGDESAPVSSMLEPLPEDDELLRCTKAGGVLTVPRARVVMAGRCLMANATGMLGIDKVIVKKIDDHYKNSATEEVPDWFWELSNRVYRKQYARVFNAMDMSGGSRYASPKARKMFWTEMKSEFFPKLKDVQGQLEAWFQQWLTKAQAMSGLQVGAAIQQLRGGGGGPSMVIPSSGIPPTNMVIASVEALIDTTQKLFAGTQRACAIAIETDAKVVRELLSRNDLHMHMGFATRQIMLKKLNIAAASDVIQMESIFAQYLLNVLRVADMPPTQQTAYFLQELTDLGTQLNFDLIGNGLSTDVQSSYDEEDDDEFDYDEEDRGRRPRGIGGRRKNDPFPSREL